ncbi:MAG: ABC transporter ATP-binding protein, partial [Actinobacteria bacterium]|nr:ABC transporter ATP-binding protein [Actinomycetota bacterium]
LGRDIRASLFRRVESLSLSQVHSLGVPSLITRSTNDVQQIQMLVMTGLTMMILAPVTAIGAIIMAVREDAQLARLLFVVIPVMLAVITVMVVRTMPLFKAMQLKIDRVNQVLRESLTGIRVVRAFNRTETEQARFAEANADLTDTSLKVTLMFAIIMPVLMLIMNLSSVAVIWFGGHLVDSGDMPIGNLSAFLAYIMQILFSVMMAVMTLMMIPRAAASAERINEVLGTEPDMLDPSPAERREGLWSARGESSLGQGRIELVGVGFRYPGAQASVVQDVSLVFVPGQATAIVGGTGSGKTTLLNLIPRLLDTTAGKVIVNGVDVRHVPMEELWHGFGIVPQKSFLFSGTIASNIRFGRPDATDDEIWRALEISQAADFVRRMPDQLGSTVDQGGANLSGGQRQRLSIARAVVRRPAVYLFDDSFSALDYATDARVRAALAKETTGSTMIMVAQRVSSIMHCDQIVVMDYGWVVGIGTHADLIDSCETYREIALSQAELGSAV